MNDPIDSIVGLLFLLIIFVVILTIAAGWKLLILGRQWLVWLYELVKSHIIQAWDSWSRGRQEAQKLDDIQVAGVKARDEIDQIMACYRQKINEILQTEGISPDAPPEVVLLATHKYSIQEDVYDS